MIDKIYIGCKREKGFEIFLTFHQLPKKDLDFFFSLPSSVARKVNSSLDRHRAKKHFT